jgi:uncharacterized protein (TIGR02453 family)
MHRNRRRTLMDFPRLSDYLARLRENNNREWFEANRPEYEALRTDFSTFVGEVIEGIGEWDETVRWVDPKDCIYRIYRDVRFSPDKTPYKTTFSAVISENGRRGHGPSYYFQVDGGGTLMAGGGVWMPWSKRLAAIREHITDDPDRLREILDEPGFKATFGGLWDIHTLKRPPAGYTDESPLIEIIKLKSFIVERERGVAGTRDEIRGWILDSFRAMYPYLLWLREAVAREAAPDARG